MLVDGKYQNDVKYSIKNEPRQCHMLKVAGLTTSLDNSIHRQKIQKADCINVMYCIDVTCCLNERWFCLIDFCDVINK